MTQSVKGDVKVREVTDEEVAFYLEHGWVKLPELIAPEDAAELLRIGGPQVKEAISWDSVGGLALKGDEPFHSMVFGEVMGRNAQRLINRRRLNDADEPVRYRWDALVKREAGGEPVTEYHQDVGASGSDRIGELNFWLALDEVTAGMGAMRFVTGSHREGLLGYVDYGEPDLLEKYPKLLDMYELSPPLHYQPGDATVHHGYTIHGAPPNTTDAPRWAYIVGYTSADNRFFKAADSAPLRGSERSAMADDRHPIVFPSQSS